MDSREDKNGVKFLSKAEGVALLNRQALGYLGMSGEDFAREYKAGRLDTTDARVIRLSFLLPHRGSYG